MPAKYENRTLEAERRLAQTITDLRKNVRGWTYEELAERMRAVGCDIHASGIQKTEKSGRRITVDELIGYSRALDVPIESLLDANKPQGSTREFWRDHLAAETLQTLVSYTQGKYRDLVHTVSNEAKRNPELRGLIEERLKKHTAMHESTARVMAEKDGEDISTPELFNEYLWRWWADSQMIAARDVLKEADDGK